MAINVNNIAKDGQRPCGERLSVACSVRLAVVAVAVASPGEPALHAIAGDWFIGAVTSCILRGFVLEPVQKLAKRVRASATDFLTFCVHFPDKLQTPDVGLFRDLVSPYQGMRCASSWLPHVVNQALFLLHEVVMKRGSPRTMKTCLPTRCRGGPAGPPRADAWVGPYLSFSEQISLDFCRRR